MKYSKLFFRQNGFPLLAACAVFIFAFSSIVAAQNVAAPRREQLLNGLKTLIWSDAKADKITVKLRVHSGAAFDPAGKEGTMRLLADSLFPEAGTREYFEEELGGTITVESNYDFLEITATGKTEEFERIMDSVRSAIISPPITPESFKIVRDARLKIIQKENQNPAAIADAAIRKRLFGDFPYGRAVDGTETSLAKIDYADLLTARDKFLTADNATLAIIGNVKESYALRAARQLFGPWRKADKLIPATFKQPETPDKEVLLVKLPRVVPRAEIRFAVRGVARGSQDFAASQIVAQIWRDRLSKALPKELGEMTFVQNEAHFLPGILIFRVSVNDEFAEPHLPNIQTALAKAVAEPITQDEFNSMKTAGLSTASNNLKDTGSATFASFFEIQNAWLDADTLNLKSAVSFDRAVSDATLAQARQVAAQWQKQTFVVVAVTQNEGNPPAK